MTATGDPPPHPNTAVPQWASRIQHRVSVPKPLNQLLVTAPSMCNNPSAHFTSWCLPSSGAFSGHLNLSKPFQRGQNCSTLVHPSANSDSCVTPEYLQSLSMIWLDKSKNIHLQPEATKSGLNPGLILSCCFSSPQAFLELQAVMNDPLDKLQFPALRHDLRHPACVH